MTATRERFVSTVSDSGRVTIPREVRRLLGIGARQKVVFVIDGSKAWVQPILPSLSEVFGVVQPLDRPEDFERLAAEAWAEKARRTEHELREG